MSYTRLIRSAGLLLAVAVLAALTTAGIALAQGSHHYTARARPAHSANVAGCPAPATGGRLAPAGTAPPGGTPPAETGARLAPAGTAAPGGTPPSGASVCPGG